MTQATTVAAVATVSPVGWLLAGPTSRSYKIGACDWTLGKRSDVAVFELAKQIGLDGVQINMGTMADGMCLLRPEVQKDYLQAARRTGVEIASLAIAEMNKVPLKSDPQAAQWLAKSIDVCKSLNLTVVLAACFNAGDLDMSKTAEIDHLVQVLKEISPQAEQKGVVIGLEIYLSAEDNMRIMDRVDSNALKVYYDVGNSTEKGRDIFKEIHTLGSRICELHAKDNGHAFGKGRIDFQKVRNALDDIDYSGWIQIEGNPPPGLDLIAGHTANCRYLKDVFSSRA